MDVVVAKEPMPNVSKKFVTKPVSSEAALGKEIRGPIRSNDRVHTEMYDSVKMAKATNVADRAKAESISVRIPRWMPFSAKIGHSPD